MLAPEAGAVHRLLDNLGRRRPEKEQERLVLGNEDRAEAPHGLALTVQIGGRPLRTLGVQPRGLWVVVSEVNLDEEFGHDSTLRAQDCGPKLRIT